MATPQGETLSRAVALRVHYAVASTAAVTAIQAENRQDGMVVQVVGGALWQYVAESTYSAGGAVLVPDDNPSSGRWISTAPQTGSLTLVSGTKTINTGITITASSRILLQMTAPGAGALGDKYKVTGKTVGGPGTGAFTVTAIAAADGTTVATDVSVHDYVIVG